MARKHGYYLSLLRHYDKGLALLALVVLLFSLVRLTQSSAERAASRDNYTQALNQLHPSHPQAVPFDMTAYEQAIVSLKAPALLVIASNDTPGLFVPERRVWCVECRRPIMFDATQCPFCFMEQPGSEKAVDVLRDTDGDGIPDLKELEWGLNPLDPADAQLDSDGDGFTNLQEYLAGTNPFDPESHPDLDVLLRVQAIESKMFPIILRGASKMPTGIWKIQVNLLTPEGREGQTFWLVEGDMIGSTGLKMGAFEEKKEKQMNPRLGILMDVDLSTATVLRESDGRTFVLTVGDKHSSDLEAVLILPLDGTTYAVSQGGEFKLRNKVYRVIHIDKQASTVVIENKSTQKRLTVPR